MEFKTTLFSFKGRMNRLPFWMIYVGITIFQYLSFVIINSLFPETTAEGQAAQQLTPMQLASYIGLIVVNIIIIWTYIAISVKRLHDRDQSGWWLLVGIIPLLGQLWYFIVVMLLPGTAGENRFGSNPREASG